jgi:hypothetical protein
MNLPKSTNTVVSLEEVFRANYIARIIKNTEAEIAQEQLRIESANRRIAELTIMLETFRAQQ